MPISYKFDGDLLIIKTEGEFQFEDLQTSINKVFADPNFNPGTKILLHDVDSLFIPTSKQIEAGTKHIEDFMKKFSAKMAIVVSSDVNYGMGRIMEIYCEQRDIDLKVFKEIDMAKRWLKE